MFNETEVLVFVSALKRNVIATGRLTEATWQALVASHTNDDGSVNWTGVIQFLNALMSDLPEILALLQAFGLVTGVAALVATVMFKKTQSHSIMKDKS
jgi:hypothetical protein